MSLLLNESHELADRANRQDSFGNEVIDGQIGAELIRPFVLVLDYAYERAAFLRSESDAMKQGWCRVGGRGVGDLARPICESRTSTSPVEYWDGRARPGAAGRRANTLG